MSSPTVNEIETARSKLFGAMLADMLALSCTPDELFADPAFAADLRRKAQSHYDRWNELSKLSARATRAKAYPQGYHIAREKDEV